MKILMFSIVCLASVALADDFKTVDGKEYKNVTVSRVEPDGIMLITRWGISKVYFTELPKEVQERFHYDAARAAQFNAEKQSAVAGSNAATQATLAAAAAKQQQEQKQKRMAAEATDMHIEVMQVVPGGALADPLIEREIAGRASSMARIGGGGGVSGGGVTYSPSGETVFVQGLGGIAERERLKIRAYREGTHTYKDVDGASRTVEKWMFVSRVAD